jgi:hypothetical protein
VRARCNLAVEEFKRGRGKGSKGKAVRGSPGEGDELAEGGDLEEQVAAAAAAEVRRSRPHVIDCSGVAGGHGNSQV